MSSRRLSSTIEIFGRAGNWDWGVGIADPFRPNRVAWRFNAPGLALAISGTAERGPHVVDPHSGAPHSISRASRSSDQIWLGPTLPLRRG